MNTITENNTITNGIQKGASTHTQGQSMTPVIFSTRNATPVSPERILPTFTGVFWIMHPRLHWLRHTRRKS